MKKLIINISILFSTLTLFLSGCSSAPKRAMQINTIRNSCTTTLELADTNIQNGNFEKAKTLLTQAASQAVSIDNYDLLVSIQLDYVSLYLSMDPPDSETAMDFLEYALEYVPYSENQSKNKALCTMAKIQIAISTNSVSLDYNSLIDDLIHTQKEFSKDSFHEAQCLSILGDLYRMKNDYTNAEKAYSAAVKQFTNERYLSEIGITWYKIAQNRSLSGNKEAALEALEKAIYYDRCAENSMALGSDYYIKGIILLKGNATEAQRKSAKTALKHSADIFDSIGNYNLANKSLAVIDSENL